MTVSCKSVSYPDLQAALAACGPYSTIVIDSDTTLAASQTYNLSNIEITSINQAKIIWPVGVTITLLGDNNKWRNCTWVGPGLSIPTSTALVFQGKGFTVDNVEAYGFKATGDSGVISHNGSTDSSDFVLRNSNFHDNAMRALVSVANCVQKRWKIHNNFLCNGIDIVPQPGGNADDMSIIGNQFTTNENGFYYSAAIQFLGGNVRPVNVVIANNQNDNYGTTVWPGQNAYALGGYKKAVITGNVYRSNGYVFGTNTYLFEVHGIEEGVVSNNVIETAVSPTSAGEDAALAIEAGSRTVIHGNVIDGFGTNPYATGIYVIGVSSYPVPEAKDIVVSNNIVRFKNGETGKGIQLECYSIPCSNWVVAGNIIDAPTTPGTFGIMVRNSGSQVFDKVLEGPNMVSGTQYGVVFGPNVGHVGHVPGINTSTTGLTQPNPDARI